MRLYSQQDFEDYRYLSKKYGEVTEAADKLMGEDEMKKRYGLPGGIATVYMLEQIRVLKGMIDNLGIEVPDDKAKALGFGVEENERRGFTPST